MSDKLPVFKHATGRWCKKIRGKHYYFGKIENDPDGSLAINRLAEWSPTGNQTPEVYPSQPAHNILDVIRSSESVAARMILGWNKWWFPFKPTVRTRSVVYALCINRKTIMYVGKTRNPLSERFRLHQCRHLLNTDEAFVAFCQFNDYWIDRVESWIISSLDPEWNKMFPTCFVGKPLKGTQ